MDYVEFSSLSPLKIKLTTIRQNHRRTLERYISHDRLGFCHQLRAPQKSSLASTATCISSLVRANFWQEGFPLYSQTADIAQSISQKNQSSSLDQNNPFSLAFVAEGLLDLGDAVPEYGGRAEHHKLVLEQIAPQFIKSLESAGPDRREIGSISIPPYPPSAYLTQLVFRVLDRCGKASADVRRLVHGWARAEINKQVALITSKARTADPLQLAYALILDVAAVPDEDTSPEDKEIFSHALRLFFSQQNDQGTWPLSRPMFHYQGFGNAYSFDYELLTQLLSCEQLRSELLRYIPELELATRALSSTEYDLDPHNPGKKIAWASGHHPQLEGPESWSTASVYHFAHALDRVVAEGIRRAVFADLGALYPGPPKAPEAPPSNGKLEGFAQGFLDANLYLPGEDAPQSLKETLAHRFVYPILREASVVDRGGSLSKTTPMSAILFGPPGTSKTELAKMIAEQLDWPLLSVDPSYLVQDGLDQIQAMANKLFNMLLMSEQVVVLLDEFDEMGRDREDNKDMLSRFITTAMLPKLAAINKERKIVFLLATNYVSGFDAAFSRGGRFDMILQVMPPTFAAKMNFERFGKTLKKVMDIVDEAQRAEFEEILEKLTFAEIDSLVREISALGPLEAGASQAAFGLIKTAGSRCTMNKIIDSKPNTDSAQEAGKLTQGELGREPSVTWSTRSQFEREQIRIPG